LAFLVLAYNSVHALWGRRFRVQISPTQLWERYWNDSTESITHAFVADIASGYVENDARLQDKQHALGRALISVGVEAAAIGAALALSSF